MKIRKVRVNKKGENRFLLKKKAISEIISYVILIAIAMAVAILVFLWLKDYTNVSPSINCKEGTSLRLDKVECDAYMIKVTVKNNGNFNIDGFIITASDDVNKLPIRKLLAVYNSGETPSPPGYYNFSSPLKPSDEPREISFAKGGYIETIQIQPYTRDEKGKIVVCENAFIKQDVSECGLLPIDPLSIQNIISWYSFNDNPSGGVNDENGNNEGTCTTCPTLVEDSERGQVYSFDGVDNYIDLGNNPSLNMSNEATMSLWIKTGMSITGGWYDLINSNGAGNCDAGSYCFRLGSNNLYTHYYNTTSAREYILSAAEINNSEWHHIASSYNGSAAVLYVDGVKTGTNYDDINGPLRSIIDVTIGNHFNGFIDDVMIFDRALDAITIQELYKNSYIIPTGPIESFCGQRGCEAGENFINCHEDCNIDTIPSLVSYWNFDDNTQDAKSSNHGILYGFNISSCESTTGWLAPVGGNVVTSTDRIEGSNSLKLTATTNDGYVEYDPAGTWDFRGKQFISFWSKSGTGSELPYGIGEFFITSTPYTNYCLWNFSYPVNWGLIRLNISNPTSCIGTVDLSAVTRVRFDVNQNGASGLVDFINLNTGYVQRQQGNALSFNGVNDYVDLGNWFDYQTFSISLWLKPGATQVQYADIIDNNHNSTSSWVLQQNSSTTNKYEWGGLSYFNLAADSWQYLTITREDETCKTYINGFLNVSTASCYPGGITYYSTRYLRLGRWGGGGRNWNGTMDEVMVFNQALDNTTIHNIYCTTGGTTGCP